MRTKLNIVLTIMSVFFFLINAHAQDESLRELLMENWTIVKVTQNGSPIASPLIGYMEEYKKKNKLYVRANAVQMNPFKYVWDLNEEKNELIIDHGSGEKKVFNIISLNEYYLVYSPEDNPDNMIIYLSNEEEF